MDEVRRAALVRLAVKALGRKIFMGEPPHGDPACGCAICMLPRGGGWSEAMLEDRLRWMGLDVHRAMRALGDFVLYGTAAKLLDSGAQRWVDSMHDDGTTPRSAGTTTVVGIDRDIDGAPRREGALFSPHKISYDDIVGGLGGDIVGRRLVRPMTESRIRRARYSLSETIYAIDARDGHQLSVYPRRMFKPTHLIVSTPENVDITDLRFGNVLCIGFATDAAFFWMPKEKTEDEWDEKAESEFLERCRIDNALSMNDGDVIRMTIKMRDPTIAKFPLHFRAVILGKEVVG